MPTLISNPCVPPGDGPTPEARPSSQRWLMISYAFSATIINYSDRQVLSVAVTSPDFKAAVPLTGESYGYITAAFMLAYGIMPLIALAIVLFLIGPLSPVQPNEYESTDTQGI